MSGGCPTCLKCHDSAGVPIRMRSTVLAAIEVKTHAKPGNGRIHRHILALSLLASLGGCAHVPADRYGVDRIRFEGVEEMDEYALRACLGTSQRTRSSFNLSRTMSPACGEAPFDSAVRVRVPLWRTGWPLFDRSVFERDLQRIQRWYRARGFYDAEIQSVSYDPPEAALDDRVSDNNTCARVGDDEGCAINLGVVVSEGQPVRVSSIEVRGDESLSASLRESVRDSYEIEVGDRFDEVAYDLAKRSIISELHNATFACAQVRGYVELNPETREAKLLFELRPGPQHVIGDVTLEGEQDLRRATILATADIDEGDLFTDKLLAGARNAVYSLGAFSSVDVIGTPRIEDEVCQGIVDVSIRVTPGRRLRYGLGGGLQSGIIGTGLQQQDVLQWDIHLLGFIEHRNFLGGLRRIRLEDRPKLIFPNSFPQAFRTVTTTDADTGVETETEYGPRPGNELRLEFRQPAFIEARTTAVVTGRWDLGPDPQDGFFRHNIDASFNLRRNFFDGRVQAAFGIHYNLFLVKDDDPTVTQSDYQVIFLEQQLTVDLRDDTRNPRLGAYFGLDLQEAAFLDWNYVRIIPDVRGYVPLGPLVLAARFRLGWMKIFKASGDLDPVSTNLGPQPYRLRAGGASSHRGFVAGFLGEEDQLVDPTGTETYRQNSGGLRRWEASVELRLPFNDDFGMVTFADMGDVNRSPSFRFQNIRLALGLGFRYQTIIGPFRLDFGWLVPGAQSTDPDAQLTEGRTWFFGKFQGAFHLTIGEAF